MGNINNMVYHLCRKIVVYFTVAFFLCFHGTAWSLNWKVYPSLTIEEVYSDNINLSNTDKKSALVTEVSPGISVNGRSSLSRFDLNYRMQNLYNAGGDSGVDINHQLQMNTNYEFLANRLYLDSSSSISQQNTSNRRVAGDNISGTNSTTVSTFSLSPYWTPHFNGYADGLLRLGYDRVATDGGSSTLSKTNVFSQNISLTSGHKFSTFNWAIEFNNSNRNNSNGDDVSFQDSRAEIGYTIGREFSVFARAGHSNNSFSSNSNSSENGISYTIGGQWKPSLRFRLQAGYGNNKFVTVDISPFNRLHWVTTYRNNDIGLNTGDTWETALNYTSRRSIWTLSYNEQTGTTQQLLLDQEIFSIRDVFNQEQINILERQGFRFDTTLPTLTDEVFITKRASLSVSYRTGKSNISADIFRILRTFEQTRSDEEILGGSASWNWNFTRRTSSSIRASWQQIESDGAVGVSSAFSDQRFDISVGLRRNILARLNGNVEYRFIDQSSDDSLNNYSENRITASLSLQF